MSMAPSTVIRLDRRDLVPFMARRPQVKDRVWNGSIAARPALIARCRTTEDIVAAVTLTRAAGIPLAVRGGWHSLAGLSTCDGGVVVDLSQMRSVEVHAGRCKATVQPGAAWADLDADQFTTYARLA